MHKSLFTASRWLFGMLLLSSCRRATAGGGTDVPPMRCASPDKTCVGNVHNTCTDIGAYAPTSELRKLAGFTTRKPVALRCARRIPHSKRNSIPAIPTAIPADL